MAEKWMQLVAPELFPDTREFKSGYTKKQKEWFKRVYADEEGVTRCHFPIYTEKDGWHYCWSEKSLQLHHIEPQGYSKRILSKDPDTAINGIYLCSHHHIGKDYKGPLNHHEEVVYVVHPDIAWAQRNYGKDRESYQKVFSGRVGRTDAGETYWNTDWDDAMLDIVDEIVNNYLISNPEDPFPSKNKR